MSEQSLSSIFKSYIDSFGEVYDEVIRTGNRSHEYGNVVRHTIPDAISSKVNLSGYRIEGSCSRGNWTPVPWIAIFDKRITKKASSGVYIVYLLNKDTKELYLTLNQAATEASMNDNGGHVFSNTVKSKSKTMISALRKRAKQIRSDINADNLYLDDINSGSPAYDAGCICYKKYISQNVPTENQLIQDLRDFLAIYNNYYLHYYSVTETIGEESEDKVPVSTKEAIKQIKEYIAAKGFSYNDELIENYFLSLKSKPFVILAGTSGTGKTRLVKLFAEAIGAEYKLVSVRPDWSDGSDLFGHYDLNGKFIEGPVCECFKLAYEKPNKPVFLCLDEMNLARVEYYLSDFLSVIESREKAADGKVFTPQIAQYANGIPDNLYIVGTVNMDETTFPFSKKVLDRANTIEFSYADLMPSFIPAGTEIESLQLPNSFLRTEYLVLNRDCVGDQEYVSEICSELQAINIILAKANAHVGYRVRDEIVFYMLNNKAEGNLLSHDEAFDNEIMQKILPRIQGSSASVKDMLCDMFTVCASDYNQKTGDTESEKMHKILSDSSINCRYRKSAEKLEMMVRRFEEDGFTSYWL